MNKFKKLVLSMVMATGMVAGLTSCGGGSSSPAPSYSHPDLDTKISLDGNEDLKVLPQATIGFKSNGQDGKYSEAIEEFEIGKTFYTCVKVQIETNRASESLYEVHITVPKTKDVIVDNRGGLDAKEVLEDMENETTILKYIVRGKKDSVPQKMLFKGTPFAEGNAKIQVEFYDHDSGEKLLDSYSMTVYFVYELAK